MRETETRQLSAYYNEVINIRHSSQTIWRVYRFPMCKPNNLHLGISVSSPDKCDQNKSSCGPYNMV